MSNQPEVEENIQQTPEIKTQRRYVGSKETLWYILYDISASFNIASSEEVFVSDVVKINMGYISAVKAIKGAWDIINDMFLGAMIDKTRTRWGKFKPYLVLYAGPGTILSMLFWLMPMLFSAMNMGDFSKFMFYLVLLLVKNLFESVRDIAKTGMLSTITPDVIDRTRLITMANLLSGFLEKTPSQLLDLLIDLSIRNIVKVKYQSLFISFGTFTVVACGIMALGFSLIARERVSQSINAPKLSHSIKMILRCKPVLLITLSEFLGSFSSIKVNDKYYYLNVLRVSSLTNIVGLPGAFVSPVSYSYVPKLRRRFSTKVLWLTSSHVNNLLMIGVFLAGSVNKGYKKLKVMIPLLMIQETIWMTTYGLMKVIPSEMYNESMDYFEWQNGYRAEAMTSVLQSLTRKLAGTVGSSLNSLVMHKLGYNQDALPGGQSDKVEYGIFAMFTVIPAVLSLIGIVPKFFYDLSGEKKDRMYEELHKRRAIAAKANDNLVTLEEEN